MSYGATYLWDFGDGETSTEENPTHVYAAGGIYTVTLSVTIDGVTETKTRVDYITVSNGNVLFEVDFSLLSNGPLAGQSAQIASPLYASAEFGTWPATAPLYGEGADPWPAYWWSHDIAEYTAQCYVQNGKMYFDGSNYYPGLPIPIYIPIDLMTNGIRVTVKYVPVGSDPGNPGYFAAPHLRFPGIRSESGNYTNGEIYYNSTPEQDYLQDYSDLVAYDNYPIGYPLWGAGEQTLVWELSAAGKLALTINGNPIGPQGLTAWYPGYAPVLESYFILSNGDLAINSINSMGYTYLKIEEV